jgi:hypothetical protein
MAVESVFTYCSSVNVHKKRNPVLKKRVIVGALVLLAAGAAQALVVNVDINGSGAVTYSGQGGYADSGNNSWNAFPEGVSSLTDLTASDGVTATTIDVSMSNGRFDYTLSNDLMSDYAYGNGSPIDVTISGLNPSAGYTLTVYCQGDQESQNATVTFGGTSETTTGDISGSLVPGGNYVVLSVTADTSGEVTGTVAPDGSSYVAINGLQIADAPATRSPYVVNVDVENDSDHATYAGQGAYADAGNTNWNRLGDNLLASDGSATTVDVSLDASSRYSFSPANANDLMADYSSLRNGDTTITMTGLVPGGTYDVYVYCQGDQVSQNGKVTIGSTTQSTSGNNSGLMVSNENYVVIQAVADDAGGLTALVERNSSSYSSVNGLQLVDLALPIPVLSTTEGDTVSGSFTVNISFSEHVTGLAPGDFSVGNGTAMSLTGADAAWSLEILPASNGDVTVTLPAGTVADLEGAQNTESNPLLVTYVSPGSTRPVATLSTASNDVYDAYTVQIDFSEPVTGFELADFDIINGTLSGLSGSGTNYTVGVTPAGGGYVTLSLPANSVMDIDGDGLQNAYSESVTLSHVETSVSSLAALRAAVQQSYQTITMAPGDYTIETLSSDLRYFPCSGSNNTIVLTDVYIEFPVDATSMEHFLISGDHNTLVGGVFENTYANGMTNVTDFVAYNEDRRNLANGARPHIAIKGSGNTVLGTKITVRGSFPYGYGSLFGIGALNTYGLDKRAGIEINGADTTIDGCELQMQVFGHGIYVGEPSANTVVKNTLVEGVVRPSNDILAEGATSLPGQNDYLDVDGNAIEADEMVPLCEDGIRMYGGGGDLTVENCVVKKMRGGIKLYLSTASSVTNSTSIDCGDVNYNMSSNGTIVNSIGNFTYGELCDFAGDKNGYDAEWTIQSSPDAVGAHNIMDVSGNDHTLVFHRVPGPLDIITRAIVVTGSDSVITNETEYPVVLESTATGNTIISCGTVTDNGSSNTVVQTGYTFATPYSGSAVSIPGQIEAEEYDLGGTGVAYSDTTSGNSGGEFRSDDVDIAVCSEGGYALTDLEDGEWLIYTISVAESGQYSFDVHYAAESEETIRFAVAENDITGDVILPATGGSDTWAAERIAQNITLDAGDYYLQVDVSGAVQLNHFTINLDGSDGSTIERIEAESWVDQSGTGLEACGDTGGGTNVSNISNGNWCRYNDLTLETNTTFNARVARPTGKSDSSIEVRLGSETGTLIGSVDVPETGGWHTYETVSTTLAAVAGEYDVVLVFVEDGTTGKSLCNLNWFELVTPKEPAVLEVPTGLAAAPESASQISVTWDAQSEVSAFHVKRAASSGGPYEVMVMGPTQTNYVDSGLLAGSSCYYVISAVLDGVESADSAEVTAVPSAPLNDGDVVIGAVGIDPDGSFAMSVEASTPGHNYQVYTSESLTDPDWQPSGDVVPGNGDELLFKIQMNAAESNCFYKLEAWRQ